MFEFLRGFRRDNSSGARGLPSNEERTAAALAPRHIDPETAHQEAMREWAGTPPAPVQGEAIRVPPNAEAIPPAAPAEAAAVASQVTSPKEALPTDPWTADDAPMSGTWSKKKSTKEGDSDSLAA